MDKTSKYLAELNQVSEILDRTGARKEIHGDGIDDFKKVYNVLVKDMVGSKVMRLLNTKTTKLLTDLDKVLKDTKSLFQPDINTPYEEFLSFQEKNLKTINNLYEDQLPRLMVQNLDFEKSIQRGFRDLIKGDSLKTGMFQKIKSELIEPLRSFLNAPENKDIPQNPDAKMGTLDKLLEKLNVIEDIHYSAQKSRG